MDNYESIVLSLDQKKTIEEIKIFIKEELKRDDPFICDHFLLRFLTVRRWDVPKTIEMLKKYFPFRDKMLNMLEDYYTRKGFLIRFL